MSICGRGCGPALCLPQPAAGRAFDRGGRCCYTDGTNVTAVPPLIDGPPLDWSTSPCPPVDEPAPAYSAPASFA